MKQFLIRLFAGYIIDDLTRQIATVNHALRNAVADKAALQLKYDELASRECKTCDALKSVINYQALCAGSRGVVFDGVGPTPPEVKPVDVSALNKPTFRGRKLAREMNQEFQETILPNLQRESDDWDKLFKSKVDEMKGKDAVNAG